MSSKYYYQTEVEEAKRRDDEAQFKRREAHRITEWIRREVIQTVLRESFDALVKSKREIEEPKEEGISERLYLQETVKKLIAIRPEIQEEKMDLKKCAGRKKEQRLGRNPRLDSFGSQEWSEGLIMETKLRLSNIGKKLTKALIEICVIGVNTTEQDELKIWLLEESFQENSGVFYVLDYIVNINAEEEFAEIATEEYRVPIATFSQVKKLVGDFHSLVLGVVQHEQDVCKTRMEVSKLESQIRKVESLIKGRMKLPEKLLGDFWATMSLSKIFGGSCFWSFVERATKIRYDDVNFALLLQIELF